MGEEFERVSLRDVLLVRRAEGCELLVVSVDLGLRRLLELHLIDDRKVLQRERMQT